VGRRELAVRETVLVREVAERLADVLRSYGAKTLAVDVPAGPEVDITALACEIAGVRIVDSSASPDVVVTADAVPMNGTVVPLKDEIDELYPEVAHVIVVRHAGDIPLAPTMDAYLDVTMIPGRDVWFHDVCGTD
jgi:acyl-coenzyme A synthetase/AMP-(fatty) acid ligase